MSRKRLSEWQQLEMVTSNPLRRQLLLRLECEPSTPIELAERYDMPLNRIGYHLRVLAELEVISPRKIDAGSQVITVCKDNRVKLLLQVARIAQGK